MKKLVFFYLLTICSLSSYAQNYFLGTSKDGIYEYYILNATVDRKMGVTEVFSRIKPVEGKLPEFRKLEIEARAKEKGSTDGFEKLGYIRRKIQYSCKAKKYRIVEIIYYELNGKVIDKEERDDKVKWEPIPGGSMRELEYKKICNL
ncbi:MAG: surface-adhesin E family protein [Bacteroidota bacterium]